MLKAREINNSLERLIDEVLDTLDKVNNELSAGQTMTFSYFCFRKLLGFSASYFPVPDALWQCARDIGRGPGANATNRYELLHRQFGVGGFTGGCVGYAVRRLCSGKLLLKMHLGITLTCT